MNTLVKFAFAMRNLRAHETHEFYDFFLCFIDFVLQSELAL
jgi:hypothetical protein